MITVSTFNVQNDFNKYNKEKAIDIYNYLVNRKIDILNLQEMTFKCEKDLLNLINNKFNIYGKYRYLIKRLKISEKVPIITNKKVLENKTIRLPHFPSLLNRVVTRALIEDKVPIAIYNTHIDIYSNEVKEKQLNKILKLLQKEKYPVILTGDFNLKTNNPVFKNFIKELNKLNINLIKTNDKTLKWSKYHLPIDHVFCSNNFKVISKKIITNIDTSDHFPVLVTLEYKK